MAHGERLGSTPRQEPHMDPRPIESLTRRETEVLRLLDVRLSIREIAEVLDILPGAVKRHARIIYRKLMVGTQHEPIAPEDSSSGSRHHGRSHELPDRVSMERGCSL